MSTYIGGVSFAHDDVQDGNVAAVLAGIGADHAVLGLQESPHDLQHGCPPHRLGGLDVLACEGCVAGLQEVAARRGDQTGHYADQIVVHVARISESRGARAHDRRDELVCLLERRLLHVERVCCDAAQGAVVKDNDGIGIFSQTSHREQRVVGLHHDVAGVLRVGKDRVRLDQLLGKAVVETFEEKRTQPAACAAGYRVEKHEALQCQVLVEPAD